MGIPIYDARNGPGVWYNSRPMLALDVVIPCLNEERALPPSVRRLHDWMTQELAGYRWNIVIADNGSADGTAAAAQELCATLPGVRYVRMEQRGRGRALRRVWTESAADIVAYMDVDLSTDLAHLKPLVDAIAGGAGAGDNNNDNDGAGGGCDLAIGSRLLPDSVVVGRTLKREITSRGYSLLFRIMFRTPFRDAQCGFKAVSRRAADDLAPLTQDNGWFFDSELLILAQKCGYTIRELPVRWTDDPDSRVRIIRTAWEDVKGLLRLKFGGIRQARRQLRAAGKL